MTQITVTNEGKKKLEQEYDFLKNVRRKEITEAIRVALGFGDLSENSEYDEAKTEQAKVEARISELEEMLKNIVVVSDEQINTDTVGVGCKVKVYNSRFDETVEYLIVGSTEASPLQNKISDFSPIGKALIGHKAGETVIVEAPAGSSEIKILEISK